MGNIFRRNAELILKIMNNPQETSNMNARNVEDLVIALNHRNESIYKITKSFLKLNKRKKFKKIDSEDEKKFNEEPLEENLPR